MVEGVKGKIYGKTIQNEDHRDVKYPISHPYGRDAVDHEGGIRLQGLQRWRLRFYDCRIL